MEKPITNDILKYLNNLQECMAWKRLNSGMSGTTGFPDVTGVITIKLHGIRIEIEVKEPGEEPSSLQYKRLRDFRKLGCIAFWCDSLDDFKDKFRYWCELHNTEKIVSISKYSDLTPKGNFIVKDL